MAVCEWRQRRVWSTETAGIDVQMDQDAAEIEKKFDRIDEPVRTAIAFKNLADNSSFLELMHCYETRFSRQYDRALRRLLELQDRRKRQPPPSEPDTKKLQNEPAPARAASEVGQVGNLRAVDERAIESESATSYEPTLPSIRT